MNVEARVIALEERVAFLETKVKALEPKMDQVLEVVVNVHNDLTAFRREVADLKVDLPDIIARAVAPMLVRRNGG
jgi:hypothetical protein